MCYSNKSHSFTIRDNNCQGSSESVLNCINSSVDNPRNHQMDLLKGVRVRTENGLSIAHLNINFLYSKFEGLSYIVEGKIDILVLTETKIDNYA